MNKLFAIAFMCIYLLLSVGVVKTTHYCMGREKSTELFSFEAKKCPCSLFIPENSGCCNDEHEVLSIDDSQKVTPSIAPISPDFFLIGSIFSKVDKQVIEQPITQYINPDFSPPPKEPLYQINCSLVFYDDEVSA
jgi:hypothetical protein